MDIINYYGLTTKLSLTKRYNGTMEGLRNPQSVAEHSYYVALLADKLCDLIGVDGDLKLKVIELALQHDFEEIVIGDIPFFVRKWIDDNRVDNAMSSVGLDTNDYDKDELHSRIVRLADIMELVLFLYSRKCKNSNILWNGMLVMLDRVLDLVDVMNEEFSKTIHQLAIDILRFMEKTIDFTSDLELFSLLVALNRGKLDKDRIEGWKEALRAKLINTL